MTELEQKIANLPRQSGCYLMKDAAGTVIYVGKAKNLFSRVSSYFSPASDLAPDKRKMVGEVVDLDYLETADEVDAILTEARLIKDIQPRYNVRLLDDKTFPYLEITTWEDFPGVYFTREPSAKSKLFGPFINARELRSALPILQAIFKFRTCGLEIRVDDPRLRFERPCLLHPIGRCTGPCAGYVSKLEYRKSIRRFERFLLGKRQALIRVMNRQMWTLSNERRYEEAARVRDQLRAIESLADRGDVEVHVQPEVFFRQNAGEGLGELSRLTGRPGIRSVEGVDIANLGTRDTVGSLVRFIDGRPFKPGYRRFRVRSASQNDYAAIEEVIFRHFARLKDEEGGYPDLLLVDGGPGQLGAALKGLSAAGVEGVNLLSLAKRAEEIFLPGRVDPVQLPANNEGLKILQYVRDEAHRFAQHYHHILRRKSLLGEKAARGQAGRKSR